MTRINTREHIINTASDLFYRTGYNLVGINEIIEKSGIAKATLYNHFASKEDLCLAYIDKMDSELLDNIAAYCATKPKGKKQLLGVLEFLDEFYRSDNFNGCWCIRTLAEISSDNKRIRKKIKDNKSKVLDLISDLVSDNLDIRSKPQINKLSKSIYLLYEGAVTESHLQDSEWPISQSIDILKTVLKEF